MGEVGQLAWLVLENRPDGLVLAGFTFARTGRLGSHLHIWDLHHILANGLMDIPT